MTNEKAGRGVTRDPGPHGKTVAANRSTAYDVAARLWPPPDPVNYLRREAVARLGAADRRLRHALDLRGAADPILFADLDRLHIRTTRAEVLLALEHSELIAAAAELSAALGLLHEARTENDIRTLEDSIAERKEPCP